MSDFKDKQTAIMIPLKILSHEPIHKLFAIMKINNLSGNLRILYNSLKFSAN